MLILLCVLFCQMCQIAGIYLIWNALRDTEGTSVWEPDPGNIVTMQSDVEGMY